MPKKHIVHFMQVALVLYLGLFVTSTAEAQGKYYGSVIAIPADAGAELKSAAADAAQILQKITGQAFAVKQENAASGICLVRTEAAPADIKGQLANKGREPFYIRSTDANKLLIVANRDEGLSHGLYFYLEELGARFYFPTEKWTIIPKRADIVLKFDRLMVPDFQLRGFSGTGGFGGATPVDPKRQMQGVWNVWKRRNRFGSEFAIGGHTGEAFNTKYKDLLIQHPEYLAKVGGKHVPWSLGAKLNTANPDAVKLYVDFRLETLRWQRTRSPGGPSSLTISAEPADGGGHCDSEECRKIGNGSPSDQVFYVANQVAKAVAKEFPEVKVTLFAYNVHAAVPSIPLEPNLYVLPVPYGFQRTGLTPAEHIQAWQRKVKASGMKSMGIYDYWSIPDWGQNLPNFNYLRTPGEKLRLWQANGVDGFASESTFSSGAMGIAWYLSSRLMWDVKTDEKAIIAEFYRDAFGKATPPMQRMLERWANGFMLTDQELALSYRDMQEAVQLADSDEAKSRIADFGRYVQYLRLRYEWTQAGKADKAAAALALSRYIWSVYDSTMIQSFRLFQLLSRGDNTLRDAFLYTDKTASGWKDLTQVTDAEALQIIEAGRRDYQPLNYEARRFTGELVPLQIGAAPPGVPVSMTFASNCHFDMQVPAGKKSLSLKVTPLKSVRLLLNDATGKNLFDRIVEAKTGADAGQASLVEIPLPGPGRYRLSTQSSKVRYTMELPQGVAITVGAFLNSQGQPAPRLFFFVPKGLKTIAVHFAYQMLPRFYDSTGKEVLPREKEVPGIVLVDIPEGQDGTVWSLVNVRTPIAMTMLNAPQQFGFYPDAMLVPGDAVK